MKLENDKYKIRIDIDDTPYTVGSADNVVHYDIVLCSSDIEKKDFYKTFRIDVQAPEKYYRIALVGSYYSYDGHCAVLDNDILTILQNDYISQIDLTNGRLINRIQIGNDIFYEIYRIGEKYIIYGELEIVCLNEQFEQEWFFSGEDIFTQFEISGERIKVWDWENKYYEINLQGKLIESL